MLEFDRSIHAHQAEHTLGETVLVRLVVARVAAAVILFFHERHEQSSDAGVYVGLCCSVARAATVLVQTARH